MKAHLAAAAGLSEQAEDFQQAAEAMHLAAVVCSAAQEPAECDSAAAACMRLQSLGTAAVEAS